MQATDIAWTAGLFEGEGSVSLTNIKNGAPRGVSLSLQMTDEDVVRRFASIVGEGKVNGPYGPYASQSRVKSMWHWKVSSAKAVARLLLCWYPLMGTRRQEQIAKAAEVLPTKLHARRASCS